MLGEAQPHALRHFDVALGAVLHAPDLVLGQRLAAKVGDARFETPHHDVVVHAVVLLLCCIVLLLCVMIMIDEQYSERACL